MTDRRNRRQLPGGSVRAAVLCLAVLALSGCAAEEPPAGTPRLILFLVVDQGRYDYFERFRPLLSSGLAR